MSGPIHVVIGSHEVIVRDVVAAALRSAGLTVSADVATLAELEAACHAGSGVDIAVLGTDIAPVEVLDAAIRRLLAAGVRSLVMTRHHDDLDGRVLLLAGASGLLAVDDSTPGDVVEAVRAVAAGHAALHPDVLRTVLAQWRAMQQAAAPAAVARVPVTLSDRERDVLAEMAQGAGNRQIARTLGIAEKTVESHKAKLRAKLGARNQAHAVSLGIEAGLIAGTDQPAPDAAR